MKTKKLGHIQPLVTYDLLLSEEKQTTTTVETKTMSLLFTLVVLIMPSVLFAEEKTTTVEKITTTETVGTVSQFNPDTIVIKSETKSSPTQYYYTKSTTYVDENGKPVSIETVKFGQPVTVYYTSEGEKMTANKVVIRKTTTTIKD